MMKRIKRFGEFLKAAIGSQWRGSECLRFAGSLVLGLLLMGSAEAWAGNWLTFGHDAQRTGWARNEDKLNTKNVAQMTLLWSEQLKNKPLSMTALTAPLVASDVTTPEGVKTLVYVGGSSDHVFALDASTGHLVWSVSFKSDFLPKYPSMWLCPENLNATPTIDLRRGLIYVLASSGRLYGLDLGTGKTRFGPIQFVPPYSKDWSLNLVHGMVFTTISQGCAETPSGIYAMDVRHPMRPMIRELLLEKGFGAGVWGRGGVTAGEDGRIYAGTGDGTTDPAAGFFGSSVIAVNPSSLKIEDYYTPNDHHMLNRMDLDLGASSPAWFANGKYHLLAVGGKGGTLYLLNADKLGSADHETPLQTLRLSNDERAYEKYGIWGGFATWRDAQGGTWLYVPVWGPISKDAPKFPAQQGPDPDGSLMAFKVGYRRPGSGADAGIPQPQLEPEWISNDFNRPEPPVIANGVVFGLSTGENAVQTLGSAVIKVPGHYGKRGLTNAERMEHTTHAILYGLDARTGKVLYSSGDAITSWVHFSGLAVANGHVYVVDHDSRIYCFGLKQ